MQKSTRAWFCRRCARATEHPRLASSCSHRAVSPCGNARTLHVLGAHVPNSVAVCRVAARGGTARKKIRCTSPERWVVPTRACCYALRLQWLPHLVRDGRPCTQTDPGCAE